MNALELSKIILHEYPESFPTGSKVFGCDTIQSDIDIVVEEETAAIIKNRYWHYITKEFGNYINSSFYLLGKLNILPVKRDHLEGWRFATIVTKEYVKRRKRLNLNLSKPEYINVFETNRDLFNIRESSFGG